MPVNDTDGLPSAVEQVYRSYRELPPPRNIRQLLGRFPVSHHKLLGWSRQYQWDERVKRYEQETLLQRQEDQAKSQKKDLEDRRDKRLTLVEDLREMSLAVLQEHREQGTFPAAVAANLLVHADSVEREDTGLREKKDANIVINIDARLENILDKLSVSQLQSFLLDSMPPQGSKNTPAPGAEITEETILTLYSTEDNPNEYAPLEEGDE